MDACSPGTAISASLVLLRSVGCSQAAMTDDDLDKKQLLEQLHTQVDSKDFSSCSSTQDNTSSGDGVVSSLQTAAADDTVKHQPPQSHSPTAPQSHSPTVPQPHSPTVLQPHSPTAPQSHSPTVLQPHSPVVTHLRVRLNIKYFLTKRAFLMSIT
ncbi:hypothetical protein C0Q70_18410 [Pomacea canaliculata]|uniref:Uncharacterized protein n=1 Tax=Pomacea canaliculata TaxID=400727 RepID=A0A2T7NN62_POMCA|nr:hypothetical protein C0Q70_18410 [Pomacea canaliculata]